MSTLFWPTTSALVSQNFAENPAVYKPFGYPGHNGIDIAGVLGDPVFATADGISSIPAQDPQGYGVYLIIRHNDLNLSSYSCHLSKILVQNNAPVQRGELIARLGSSGFSTGPHLHFGLRKASYSKTDPYKGFCDPLSLLQCTSSTIGTSPSCFGTGEPSLEPAPLPHASGQAPHASGQPPGSATVQALCINVRQEPSVNSALLGQLYQGASFPFDSVFTDGRGNTWLSFCHSAFWVASSYDAQTYVTYVNHAL